MVLSACAKSRCKWPMGSTLTTQIVALPDWNDQLMQQIDLIAENANFNGVKLLDGSTELGIQTGPTPDERPSIFFKDNTTSGLSIDTVCHHSSQFKGCNGNPWNCVDIISDELSRAGAYENRFGHTICVLENTVQTKISRGASWTRT